MSLAKWDVYPILCPILKKIILSPFGLTLLGFSLAATYKNTKEWIGSSFTPPPNWTQLSVPGIAVQPLLRCITLA